MGDEEEAQAERQKKLHAYLARMNENAAEEEKKKQLLAKLVDEKAFDRLMNVRIGHDELYNGVISLLVRLANAGQIKGKLNEEQVVKLLSTLTEREVPKIQFKRK
ncbi:hypothetical protein COT30_00070 [Candidatus Micrarchaeota archaeon CG08_land_8_20_14_0_20_49_17]|nr:MAG: hypothetical protein AUJ13_03130 [Candidatus Micrarchaeota archaeon CG1_02_49_24]PIU10276.1 MAG: hypothetical protein COT30_00070 [Candidatus Micrarchaeota archaeon CG08_land_8_20_14_0_20_49_17]PIZ99391.1 MAG: hypothetical protein COX84_01065 [Candidatus Micrarchaeota archaeon CG_4_10_14_0_2_um_filter_49_7]